MHALAEISPHSQRDNSVMKQLKSSMYYRQTLHETKSDGRRTDLFYLQPTIADGTPLAYLNIVSSALSTGENSSSIFITTPILEMDKNVCGDLFSYWVLLGRASLRPCKVVS